MHARRLHGSMTSWEIYSFREICSPFCRHFQFRLSFKEVVANFYIIYIYKNRKKESQADLFSAPEGDFFHGDGSLRGIWSWT